MGKRFTGFLSFLLLLSLMAAAQVDSAGGDVRVRRPAFRLQAGSRMPDSLQAGRDSVRKIQDSLSMVYLKAPRPDRPNPFLDSLLEVHTVKNLDFAGWAKQFPKKVNRQNEGKMMPKREPWVIYSVLFLITFFAVLRNAFPKELESMVQSFYDNRVLGKVSQEDNVLGSRPFLFFYLLFGLTIAMFLYLVGKFLQLEYSADGFEWFLILAALIMGLFALKIIVLRLLAVLFDLGKMVRQYTTILYISYFNAAFVFLPLVVGFSLASYGWGSFFCYAALLLVGAVFIFQVLRAATLILSEYQFSKVYLIIYLCALEICPLLILVKALRF